MYVALNALADAFKPELRSAPMYLSEVTQRELLIHTERGVSTCHRVSKCGVFEFNSSASSLLSLPICHKLTSIVLIPSLFQPPTTISTTSINNIKDEQSLSLGFKPGRQLTNLEVSTLSTYHAFYKIIQFRKITVLVICAKS